MVLMMLLKNFVILLTFTKVRIVKGSCQAYVDVVIGIETSGSNGGEVINRSVPHAERLINALDGNPRFRTAVVAWTDNHRSSPPQSTIYPFSSKETKQQKVQKVRNFPYILGPTNDYNWGVELAFQRFNEPNLAPREAAKIFIFISDGIDDVLTTASQDRMKNARITSIAVQTVEHARHSNLQSIASGDDNRVYNATLESFNSKLLPDILKIPCSTGTRYLKANEVLNGTLEKDDQRVVCFADISKGTTIEFYGETSCLSGYFSYQFNLGVGAKFSQNEGEVLTGSYFYPNDVINAAQLCVRLVVAGSQSNDNKYSIRFRPGGSELDDEDEDE